MAESIDKPKKEKKSKITDKNVEILDNVVYLDNFNILSPPQTLSEMKNGIEEYRKKFSKDVSIDITKLAVYELMRAGAQFNTEDPGTNKQINFVAEAIASLYLYTCNIDHPVQELSENYIEDDETNIMEEDDDE
jgi:hypothetical protein